EGINVADRQRLGRNLAHEALELLVAGDEIGLGIDLDEGSARALDREPDQAFRGDATRLLGGSGKTLLAQPVEGALEVALRLGQRLLAIHHAGPGLLPKLLDQRRSDLGHDVSTPQWVAVRRAHAADPMAQACAASPLSASCAGNCSAGSSAASPISAPVAIASCCSPSSTAAETRSQ